MGFLKRLFGGSSESAAPKFLRKEQSGNNTYELYVGKDAQSARQFLLTKKVEQKLYYIVVETPEGNWGMDNQGLYLERLLPWQISSTPADCEGSIIPMTWNLFGLQMAGRKINDNFLVEIECGSCSNRWTDGVRYQDTTLVRCPHCKKLNRVNSENIKLVLV
jgi:phage FluMu protein Com